MPDRIDEPAPANPEDLEIVYNLEGPVDPSAQDDAEAMIQALTSKTPRPVIYVRVKLTVAESRPDEERAIAQGLLDVSGSLMRAQVAAPSITEAIDALGQRLDRQLSKLAERRQDERDRPPATPDGEWRRGDMPSSRPEYFDRPQEERRIVRRKSFAPGATSVEEALFDLDVMDYRFFLFTDEIDGVDALVYETDDGPVLRRVTGDEPASRPDRRPLVVEVDSTPAPTIDVDEALQRLNVSHEPFILFTDADSNRGTVAYRRYDGHYGLIEPGG